MTEAEPKDTSATEPVMLAEPIREPEVAAVAPPPVAPAPKRQGFAGGLVGGLIAAGLGFGLAQVVPDGWPLAGTAAVEARVAAQEQTIAALKTEVAALRNAPAPDARLADRVASLESAQQAPTDLGPLEQRLAALESKVAEIGSLPADGSASSAAIAALQAEVDALKGAGGSAEIDALVADAKAQAAAIQAEAQASIVGAKTFAALGRIRVALDSGAPFDAALAGLGPDVPTALSATAATGVPTLESLKTSFPQAARAALAVGQKANPEAGWTERIGTFLRSQTGARALTPREGTDPDAVLSRAEAALTMGNLDATMSELAALPEAERAAMGDWIAEATRRQAAEAAVAELASALGQ